MVPRKTAYKRHAGPSDLAVEAEIAQLPAPEATVLRMRYGLRRRPRTIAQVADAVGVSLATARRLHGRALQRLRRLSLTRD